MKFVTESFSTIEQYTQAFAEISMDTMQLSSGLFNSWHHIVMLPQVSISTRRMSLACLHHGTMDEEIYFFILPDKTVAGRFCGLKFNDAHLLICDNTRDYITQYEAGFSGYTVTVPKSYFCRYLGIEHAEPPPDLAAMVSLGLVMLPHMSGYKTQVMALIEQVSRHRSLFASVQAQLDVQERICLLLARAIMLVMPPEPSAKLRLTTRQNVVVRSLDYIKTQSTDALSVAELCKASHCSIRTLEYAFKNLLGMTPKQYLSRYRLHQIHHMLITGGFDRVEPVIQSFGIVNTGRFARDFYQLFGEYPKQTLKKKISGIC